MKIEVLHLDDCPNHRPTLELVREVVQDLGIHATILEVVVDDPNEVARLRFLGSPTVHVNGEDADPAARDRADFSFSCRMYGRSGSPPRSLVEQAVRVGAGAGQDRGGALT